MAEERDEPLTGTAGTDLEGSEAGTADEVVGTPGWKAASGAAELQHEQAERDAEEAAASRARADSADRPPGGSG